MKRHLLFCLLLAFSASAHARHACFELDAGSVWLIYVLVDGCDSPFPEDTVTSHTKNSGRAAPKSYELDENIFKFEEKLPGQVRAQTRPKATSGQGIGVRGATADVSGRYLYVASNGTNEISAYQVDPASGELTDIPGAPFKTGKSPSAVVVHPSNRFLYTTDFSAATVSAFRIDPANGALTALGSIATAELPGSIAIHPSGRFLYITCAAKPGASVVQAYAIDIDTGALNALGNPVAPQAFPNSIVVDPFGKFVYFLGNGIEAFAVGQSGTLTRIQGTPFAATSFGQLVMAPGGKFLYALDPSAKTVSVFRIDRATGALSAIPGSPYAAGSNPVWLTVTPTGRALLIADPGSLVNNGTDRIGIYAVDAETGALAPIAGSPFAAQGPNTPDVIAVNAVLPKSFAKLGADYANNTFQVRGGTSPYAWSISGGALPPGLALDAQTGRITGVPTQMGTFEFTIKVADAVGFTAPLADFITVNDTGLPSRSSSSAPSAFTVMEFYNAALDHYFITWVPAEIAKLDAGVVIKGWTRTGQSFKTYTTPQSGTSPVCRYYIPPALGDSHFFGRGTAECNATGQNNPSFALEDAAFMQMHLPTAGTCPAGTTQIYRVFSGRPDANHRYMTDRAIRDEMVAKGWLPEGDGPDLVVMCAPQ